MGGGVNSYIACPAEVPTVGALQLYLRGLGLNPEPPCGFLKKHIKETKTAEQNPTVNKSKPKKTSKKLDDARSQDERGLLGGPWC